MSEHSKYDKLDRSIAEVIARGESPSSGDEDVDALGRLAVGLRGLARPEFRARLRAEFVSGAYKRGAVPVRSASARLPFVSWFTGQRPFLAAGSSFGLAAGACCLSGLAANVLGIASADAARTFISSSLPYFVALSLMGLAGWIVWLLREQGVTPTTVTRLVRQHGLAIGSSYAAVFAASMALASVRGIY
jgi:hypothetical protein